MEFKPDRISYTNMIFRVDQTLLDTFSGKCRRFYRDQDAAKQVESYYLIALVRLQLLISKVYIGALTCDWNSETKSRPRFY